MQATALTPAHASANWELGHAAIRMHQTLRACECNKEDRACVGYRGRRHWKSAACRWPAVCMMYWVEPVKAAAAADRRPNAPSRFAGGDVKSRRKPSLIPSHLVVYSSRLGGSCFTRWHQSLTHVLECTGVCGTYGSSITLYDAALYRINVASEVGRVASFIYKLQ